MSAARASRAILSGCLSIALLTAAAPSALADGDSEPLIEISNSGPECRQSAEDQSLGLLLTPFDHEADQYGGTRLSPPEAPFEVLEIRYFMVSGTLSFDPGSSCDSTLSHRLSIYVTHGATPPPNAAPETSMEVPEEPGAGRLRVVHLRLPEPVVLQPGEDLFIAISHPDFGTLQSCTLLCPGPDIADCNWWSNSVDPPYHWTQLQTFGINRNMAVSAFGRVISQNDGSAGP